MIFTPIPLFMLSNPGDGFSLSAIIDGGLVAITVYICVCVNAGQHSSTLDFDISI